MGYTPSTDTGIPKRPAGQNYVGAPSGASESPRTPRTYWGAGAPQGVVTGIIGDQYFQQDGTYGSSLWVKESGTGSSGWVPRAERWFFDGFFIDNAAASQTNTVTKRFTSSGAGTNPYCQSIVVPYDCNITGLLYGKNGTQSAGTITIGLWYPVTSSPAGAPTQLTLADSYTGGNILPGWWRTNGVQTQTPTGVGISNITIAGIGSSLQANDIVTLVYTSTGTLSPTTMDFVLGLQLTRSDPDSNDINHI